MIRTGQLLAEVAEDQGYEVVGIDLFRTAPRRPPATSYVKRSSFFALHVVSSLRHLNQSLDVSTKDLLVDWEQDTSRLGDFKGSRLERVVRIARQTQQFLELGSCGPLKPSRYRCQVNNPVVPGPCSRSH